MSLPSGTLTFLFSDIEGSTRLWEQQPEAMYLALANHNALMRAAIEDNHGEVFKTVGDAFCAAFATASDALKAALDGQLALQRQPWNETGPIRVRMGLHTGHANFVVEMGGVRFFGRKKGERARFYDLCALSADVHCFALQKEGQTCPSMGMEWHPRAVGIAYLLKDKAIATISRVYGRTHGIRDKYRLHI